jgi:hypothetical protein
MQNKRRWVQLINAAPSVKVDRTLISRKNPLMCFFMQYEKKGDWRQQWSPLWLVSFFTAGLPITTTMCVSEWRTLIALMMTAERTHPSDQRIGTKLDCK